MTIATASRWERRVGERGRREGHGVWSDSRCASECIIFTYRPLTFELTSSDFALLPSILLKPGDPHGRVIMYGSPGI